MTADEFDNFDEQDELAEVAAEIDYAAMDMAEEGVISMVAGAEDLDFADEVATTAAAKAMTAASDLTRAVDASIVADRLATLSEVVAAAGVNDLGQGAELIAASDDVEAVSAAVGLMTLDDLDKGLELARLAGELQMISNVVGELEMPVLSAVLGDRGQRLQEIATDTVLRAAATRSLVELIDATGRRIGDMGVEEMDEGALRLAASDIAAERSAELSAAGMALGARGVTELDMAAEDAKLARDFRAVGVAEVAMGAEALGRASAMEDVADAFDEESAA